MIFVATTNTDKLVNISYQIHLLYPSLNIDSILSFGIKPPDENGKSEKENCLIKARYYYSKIKRTIISEDSGIYFDNLLASQQPGYIIHRKNQSIKNPIDYWKEYIRKNKIESGKILKYYCVAHQNKFFICQIVVPVTFNFDYLSPTPPSFNIFNNFMVPKGFSVPINKLTHEEKDNFYREYYLRDLEKLFKDSRLDK